MLLKVKKFLVFSLAVMIIMSLSCECVAFGEQRFEQIVEFNVPEANQRVGVDALYFYAVDNRTIVKHDKTTGQLVTKWEGPKGGPIIHFDSAVVVNEKVYCAHSNYHEWPMTSSIEIFDAATLEHIGSHSFGIHWGSCTWVDYYDGFWWATFANYDKPYGPGDSPYGYKACTTLVKFDNQWQWKEAWVLPETILKRLEDMSNSGGSWGPDGFLYLSGHDPAEVYKCRLPKAGSVLELIEIIPLNIRGQGIAWDRSNPGVLYGIIRATDEEEEKGITHKVTVHRLTYRN
jgi:hypothetical protein